MQSCLPDKSGCKYTLGKSVFPTRILICVSLSMNKLCSQCAGEAKNDGVRISWCLHVLALSSMPIPCCPVPLVDFFELWKRLQTTTPNVLIESCDKLPCWMLHYLEPHLAQSSSSWTLPGHTIQFPLFKRKVVFSHMSNRILKRLWTGALVVKQWCNQQVWEFFGKFEMSLCIVQSRPLNCM